MIVGGALRHKCTYSFTLSFSCLRWYQTLQPHIPQLPSMCHKLTRLILPYKLVFQMTSKKVWRGHLLSLSWLALSKHMLLSVRQQIGLLDKSCIIQTKHQTITKVSIVLSLLREQYCKVFKTSTMHGSDPEVS